MNNEMPDEIYLTDSGYECDGCRTRIRETHPSFDPENGYALYIRADKAVPAGWQPIETAPHGVWILIYAYRVVSMACWHADGYWLTFKDNRIMPIAAKHWMPLPQPPTKGGI